MANLSNKAMRLMRPMLAALLLCSCTAACAENLSEDRMRNLENRASLLGLRVYQFSVDNPELAQGLDARQLVRKALEPEPEKLAPFEGLVVLGKTSGVILVCTQDGKVALFEDAVCTKNPDDPFVKGRQRPCDFILEPKALCPAIQ
ncbi:MAG: hypothetical protein WC722_19005 [Rhodospirillales bacterium]|jgi:hypothetical protein